VEPAEVCWGSEPSAAGEADGAVERISRWRSSRQKRLPWPTLRFRACALTRPEPPLPPAAPDCCDDVVAPSLLPPRSLEWRKKLFIARLPLPRLAGDGGDDEDDEEEEDVEEEEDGEMVEQEEEEEERGAGGEVSGVMDEEELKDAERD